MKRVILFIGLNSYLKIILVHIRKIYRFRRKSKENNRLSKNRIAFSKPKRITLYTITLLLEEERQMLPQLFNFKEITLNTKCKIDSLRILLPICLWGWVFLLLIHYFRTISLFFHSWGLPQKRLCKIIYNYYKVTSNYRQKNISTTWWFTLTKIVRW